MDALCGRGLRPTLLLLCVAQGLALKSFLNQTAVQTGGCGCKAMNPAIQNKPAEAVADAGQALPDCFAEAAVDSTTFGTPESTLENCLLQNGFAQEPEANKLKCLAPDGVVGTKTAPAFYLVGDSHSVSLRTSLKAATRMPVYSASWWGSTHPGKIADIIDVLGKVVQAKDIVGFSMRWDVRTPQEFMADVTLLQELCAQKGAYLVIFEDNPILKDQSNSCYMHVSMGGLPTSCSISWAEVQAAHKPFTDAISALTASAQGVYFFNWVVNLLCDSASGSCDYNIPGLAAPAYRDEDHLSDNGARYLAPFICNFLKTNALDVGGFH